MLEGQNYFVSAAFSPYGRYLATGSGNNLLVVWDLETGEIVSGPLEVHINGVDTIVFSSDGKHIASGSYCGTILVCNVETGELVFGPFSGHADSICSITFSPNGG